MPTTVDLHALESVAALLAEARALYADALPFVHQSDAREALCGVIAVREALHLRLRDLMGDLGARAPAPGAIDAASLIIHRALAQGDLGAALREIDAWDARLRDGVHRHAFTPGLSADVEANLLFTRRILDVAPAALGAHAQTRDSAAA
ncbi:MAG: hypothetical protein NW200_03850 [Hyphomonadaceae bacterium]|nr:hypothetical protein [Hyphomonadaceae bacterium]